MRGRRVVVGIVVTLLVAQAAAVIVWPYVRRAREARQKAEVRARRATQVEPIAEAVLRYWIDEDFARERDRGDIFTVNIGATGPSDALLQRFADGKYGVRSGPAIQTWPSEGPWIRLSVFSWHGESEVEVSGTAFYSTPGRSRPSTYLMSYRVRREQGKWQVVTAEEVATTWPLDEVLVRYCIDHVFPEARARGETFLLRREGGRISDGLIRRLGRAQYPVARLGDAAVGARRGPIITLYAMTSPRNPRERPAVAEVRVQGTSGPAYALRFHLRWDGPEKCEVAGAERER